MTRKQMIYEFLRKMKSQHGNDAAYSTQQIAGTVGVARSNVSSDLNKLFAEGMVDKLPGWPVKYRASAAVLTPMPPKMVGSPAGESADSVFAGYIGYNGSMSMEIEKAKAGVLYPLGGLPILIEGKTGTGKTTFAKVMYDYAKRARRIRSDAKFISFNCADYASNPQLIMAQLFGCAKGAYTGAEEERVGLVEQADQGVLFLDEVHRLPETAQEMLFYLMDFGQFHRLGEPDITRNSTPIIMLATTEDKNSALLSTFNRRIPITVTLPELSQRSLLERLSLIKRLFSSEARKLGFDLRVDSLAIKALLAYDCPGNVGQLENDVRTACAKGYVACLMEKREAVSVGILDLPLHVKDGIRSIRHVYSDINLICSGDLEFAPIGELVQEITPEPDKWDIYDLLEHRHKEYSESAIDGEYLQLAMMLDIESYFNNLLGSYRLEQPSSSVMDCMDKRAEVIASQAQKLIEEELNHKFSQNDRTVLALHLNIAIRRIQEGKNIICPILSAIRHEYAGVFALAEHIVALMQKETRLSVPCDEAGFIANLLIKMFARTEGRERCGVIVVCQGIASAKTMAKVANGIVNKEFVHWLDTADLSGESHSKMVAWAAQHLHGISQYPSGLVVMFESERFSHIGLAIQELSSSPIYKVFNISTAMVVEASLLAVEHNATAQQIYYHLKKFEQGFNELFELESKKLASSAQKKVIITACISGCGAAARLKRMIESQFAFPDDIEIITIDIPSIESLKNRLAQIGAVREVICVIGMDVGLEATFPFISAEDIVIGNGIRQLSHILSNYQVYEKVPVFQADCGNQIENVFVSGKYLSNYLFYLDGEKLAPFLLDCTQKLESSRGEMQPGKRMMLFIHICSMIERLLFEKEEQLPAQHAAEDLIAAFEAIEQTYHITIPDEEFEMVEQIFALVLNK
ncbi:sigma 54-interacting transcriptional regulator [Oscillospiraceae bacterium MB08-C2-2]|nr:sigma 54-interacting transcriptional regulator [Oscillospiraceae bacterium MB08-C2-2]